MPFSWVGLAGGALSAFGSIAGSNTQAGGQQQAAQTQQNMFNTINANNQPYMQGGYQSLNALLYGLGLGGVSTPSNPNALGSGAAGGGSQPIQMPPGWSPTTSGGNIGGVGGAGTAGETRTGGITGNDVPGGSASTFLPGGGMPGEVMPTVGAGTQVAGGGSGPGAFGPGPASNPTQGPGGLSFGQLSGNFTPQDFLNNVDPGYGFQLQTGGNAVRNADTPSQGALSGATLKDLMGFNQGMAATGYQNAYNRWQTTNQNIFSRLSGIAGLGQNASTNVGTSGTQLGTGIGQAQAGAGASQGAGIIGATNSLGSSLPLSYLMAQQNAGGGVNVNPNSTTLQDWGTGTGNFQGGGDY